MGIKGPVTVAAPGTTEAKGLLEFAIETPVFSGL